MKEVPLSEVMATITPGDGHSWETEMDWIKEHHLPRLINLTFDIAANGINTPILIGNDGRLWDGHHRVTAAYDLGLETIPIRYAQEET